MKNSETRENKAFLLPGTFPKFWGGLILCVDPVKNPKKAVQQFHCCQSYLLNVDRLDLALLPLTVSCNRADLLSVSVSLCLFYSRDEQAKAVGESPRGAGQSNERDEAHG